MYRDVLKVTQDKDDEPGAKEEQHNSKKIEAIS